MADTNSPCQWCFSYGLYQDHGVLVCGTCGQQQQGYIEEGDDDGAAARPGARTLRLTRQTRATETVRAAAERTLAASRQQGGVGDALRLYVPCLQCALSAQADALCAEFDALRGQREQLRAALWALWCAHLTRTGALEPSTWRDAEHRVAKLSSGGDGNEGDDHGGGGGRFAASKDVRQAIAIECHAALDPSSLITLLALTVHYVRSPLTALDVLRAAASGAVPYWDLAAPCEQWTGSAAGFDGGGGGGGGGAGGAAGAGPASAAGGGGAGGALGGALGGAPAGGPEGGSRGAAAGAAGGGGGAAAGAAGGGGGAAAGAAGRPLLGAHVPGAALLELALQPDSLPTLPELLERIAWEASAPPAASTGGGGRGAALAPLGVRLPPVNAPLLLQRFAAELELPQEVAAVATRLYRLRAGAQEHLFWRQSGTPPYTAVVALLAVALQLLYGLDGMPRAPPPLPPLPAQPAAPSSAPPSAQTTAMPPVGGWPTWAARQVSRVLQPSKHPPSALAALSLPPDEWRAWAAHLRRGVFGRQRGPPELGDVLALLQEMSTIDDSSDAAPVEAAAGDQGAGRGTGNGDAGDGAGAGAGAGDGSDDGGDDSEWPAAPFQRKRRRTTSAAAENPDSDVTIPAAAAATQQQQRRQQAPQPLLRPGTFVSWGATRSHNRRGAVQLSPDAAVGFHPDYAAVLAATAALVWASPLQVHQHAQLLLEGMEADERALRSGSGGGGSKAKHKGGSGGSSGGKGGGKGRAAAATAAG